jgi:hypothetical protein
MFFWESKKISAKRTINTMPFEPVPGSEEEKNLFREIQDAFTYQYQHVFPDKLASRTIVIIPSMTLDQDILSKIRGHVYYEERMLCLLMLLRMPKTEVVFISSVPIDEIIVDYYLHLLPGITGHHARQRLTMFSCHDASAKPLTQKILDRPRLINRIRQKITNPLQSHLVFFNVAEQERTLAVQLGIPVYGCNPEHLHMGTKSGSRKLFRECGIAIPDGFENLYTKTEITEALYTLKKNDPGLRKAVIKINEGFSGEGNAIFNYQNVLPGPDLKQAIEQSLSYIHIVADKVNYEQYFQKFEALGGIVEAFLDGENKASPSAQCRINPLGEVTIISTHDQHLGGEDKQVFIGASFPASPDYAVEIASMSRVISEKMAKEHVLGRFSIDFLSIFENNAWKHYAIEINLRKGGTTHPFLMLQFLTDGSYQSDEGIYMVPMGQKRYYFASDNVASPAYAGLTPEDLIDIAMYHDLLYDATTQEGVMFHLIGALSQYGKLGMVCIASTPHKSQELFEKTIDILNRECNHKS